MQISSLSVQSNMTINRFTDKMRSLFNVKLNEFNDLYSGARSPKESISKDDKIVFILPLAGRYETFLRFLNNFEDVSIGVRLRSELVELKSSFLDRSYEKRKRGFAALTFH